MTTMFTRMLAMSSDSKPTLSDDEFLNEGLEAATTCVPTRTENPVADSTFDLG